MTAHRLVFNVKDGNAVKFEVAQLAKEFAQLVLALITNGKDGLQRAQYKMVILSHVIPQMKPSNVSGKFKLDANITSKVQ